MDPLYDGIQNISSTLTYTQKASVSNSNFGDVVNYQVLATMSQCGVFVFGEIYHKKVLDDKSFIFTQYRAMSDPDKAVIDGLARELITSRLIIKNCTSSCARTYLKENCFVGAMNYPSTIVATTESPYKSKIFSL